VVADRGRADAEELGQLGTGARTLDQGAERAQPGGIGQGLEDLGKDDAPS
jgi:hypothetical protein